ncbi:MAG TPA: hypothetical protein PLJ27_13465, partial [Polyangiaceae bacterium]|nr:hypothetical protein [Polyangiaceae bacterium]
SKRSTKPKVDVALIVQSRLRFFCTPFATIEVRRASKAAVVDRPDGWPSAAASKMPLTVRITLDSENQ